MFTKDEEYTIKILIQNALKIERNKVEKYGHNDEATAGSQDFIEIANSILDKLR